MTANIKGNIGLTKVIADLTEKGYHCFLPIADTTSVDLIISNKEMEIKKIQIKYRKIDKNGRVVIPTESVINGKRVSSKANETDIWAVYCPDNNKIYYIKSSFLEGKTQLSLRVNNSSKLFNTITFASEFEDINKAW